MKFRIFSIIMFLAPALLIAQQTGPAPSAKRLYGIVTNDKNELLIGATVQWADTKQGTITDTLGRFWLPRRDREATLWVKYIGFDPAQVNVLPQEDSLWIEVSGINKLQEVTISEHGFDNQVSTIGTRNVESIRRNELRKAPCCNLSESFETNGAADVTYANALTGVKEIQMLGLRGIYSQFMVENRPTMGGIATPFAFEYIPGTWLDGIQLAKGASTVKNGYTGISGQVNAEIVKPQLDKPLFINAFSSTEGRGELNLHLNHKGKGKISQGLLAHGSFVQNRWDMNADTFYDSPNRHQLNGLYRAFYESPDWCGQFNVHALTDRRQSVQIRPMALAPDLFTIDQQNDRIEVWGKVGREGLFGKPYNQLGNMLSASWHRTHAIYGRNNYDATQRSVYWQSLYQTILGTTDHQIVAAPSFQYDDIDETVVQHGANREEKFAFQPNRTEAVPGMMLEYTYSRPNLKLEMPDIVVVLGARADWNSRFGWLFTPRLSAKYNFSADGVFRVSAGRGYRSPNLIAENISLLASNDTLHFAANPGLEEAWNYGVNFTQKFKIAQRSGSLSLDLYRTDFVRQVLVDVDQSPTNIYFYNVKGKSFSNSLLAMLQYNPVPGLDVKVAYKWNDARATYADGQLKTLPLIAKHRGLVTLDYTTPDKKWMFNTNLQIVGSQRLPDNSKVPHEIAHGFPVNSPTFAVWNAQITRSWKKFEVYIGGENLANYRQHDALMAASDPWGPWFNGAQIWAPMMGRVAYVGVRVAPAGL